MKEKQRGIIYDPHDSPVTFQAQTGEAVTVSDTATFIPGVLYIGTGGNVNVHTKQGADLVFANVADGTFLPIIVDMVYSTSTTASDILILR